MADSDRAGNDSGGDASGGRGGPSATPFLVALTIVVVGLVALFVVDMVRPPGENLTDDDMIARVANDYVQVHTADDTDAFARITCSDFDLEAGPVQGDGEAELHGVRDIAVDGDTATAVVDVSVDGASSVASTWNFTREGDDPWRVCN